MLLFNSSSTAAFHSLTAPVIDYHPILFFFPYIQTYSKYTGYTIYATF